MGPNNTFLSRRSKFHKVVPRDPELPLQEVGDLGVPARADETYREAKTILQLAVPKLAGA